MLAAKGLELSKLNLPVFHDQIGEGKASNPSTSHF
jgi:hypothetical protein